MPANSSSSPIWYSAFRAALAAVAFSVVVSSGMIVSLRERGGRDPRSTHININLLIGLIEVDGRPTRISGRRAGGCIGTATDAQKTRRGRSRQRRRAHHHAPPTLNAQ